MMSSTKLSTSLLLLLATTHVADVTGILSKMVAEEAWDGKPFGLPYIPEIISSKSSVLLGECEAGVPYEIELYGPGGMAAVGISKEASDKGIEFLCEEADIHVGDTPQSFFQWAAADSSDDLVAYAVEYILKEETETKEGIILTLLCDEDTPVMVIANDKADLEIQATVTPTKDGNELKVLGSESHNSRGKLQGHSHSRAEQEWKKEQRKAKKDSAGQNTRFLNNAAEAADNAPKAEAADNAPNSAVTFVSDSESDDKILIKHDPGNPVSELAFVDGYYTSESGHKIKRTFFQASSPHADPNFHNPSDMNVDCCDITEDGDVVVNFPPGLLKSDSRRVAIRLGIVLDDLPQPIAAVDVAAMLTEGKTITVHGGWVRRALAPHGMDENSEGWDIKVLDGEMTDPKNKYERDHIMRNKGQGTTRRLGSNHHRRKLLSQKPSPEEVAISKEMMMGRKPSQEEVRRHLRGNNLREGRRLPGGPNGPKLMLVHGYCSGDVWKGVKNQFDDNVRFQDLNQNRGHDAFAILIANFGASHPSFGVVAHSQGGAAALHLYTYYWSGLDYVSSGSRLIQTVGTPFQGTALAGNLAVIGEIFGAGCGANGDMTYSGASAWLSGIPTWARSQVNYYTTSFEDVWWRWDYCHLSTDLLLSDPEDGTTEKWAGQLPGGVNRGHKSKWCHTSGMRDPAEVTDSSRNSDMNSYAAR